MRCFSSAFSSRLGGIPGSSGCTATSSSASTRRLIHRTLSVNSRTVLLALGILLVIDVFLPELLLQLRIGLLLRRLPQPARDDIVVAAVGNLTRARAVAGVVVGFLAGLLGLQVTRRIAGP